MAPQLILPALVLALSLALPQTASAASAAGPRSAAMADGGRGLATTNDAVFLNPAGLPRFSRYTVAGYWHRGTRLDGNRFTASVVDSKTGPVAGAVAYTWESVDENDAFRGSRIDVAAGWPLARFLLVGVGVHYLGVGTEGDDVRRFTGDVGLMILPVPWLSLGMVGHNVINPVEEAGLAPRTYGVGLSLSPMDRVVLTGDWQTSLEQEGDPDQWSVGGEYFAFGSLAFRGGWTRDGLEGEDRWTAGVGLVTPSFGLDLAYGRTLGEGPEGIYYTVGMRLFL